MFPAGCRKCVKCNEVYRPDARNRYHQRYCPKPVCRQASKAASQGRWRAKPENADYDRGNAKNAARARAWQKAHPGYWKRRRAKRSTVLQDILIAEVAVEQKEVEQDDGVVLRDISRSQVPLIMGLIAHLGDLSYAEDIVAMAHRLVARGQALMGKIPNHHDAPPKTNPLR
jgi:hypothetical protein